MDQFHILRMQEQDGERMNPEPEQPPAEYPTDDYEPMNRYVDINANVLPKIDYERLQADYGTEEKPMPSLC